MTLLSIILCIICFVLGANYKKILHKALVYLKKKKEETEEVKVEGNKTEEDDEEEEEIDFEDEDLKMVSEYYLYLRYF